MSEYVGAAQQNLIIMQSHVKDRISALGLYVGLGDSRASGRLTISCSC
jgi:hypothetical protein